MADTLASASAALRVHLLGGFRLEAEGEPLPAVVQPRLQFLLAYLLLHRGAPTARQQLAFAFWPDSPEEQAHSNLRNLLHRLRATLPHSERFIGFDRHHVWWQDAGQVVLDVAEFERALAEAGRGEAHAAIPALAAALAHYTGDLLPECYDDWIAPIRERLSQAATSAAARLAAQLEAAGDYPAAIRCVQRLAQQDPLNEAIYRDLMRLHARTGDRAGVVRVFNACAAALRRELNAGPEAATRAAYRQALEQAAHAAATAAHTAPRGPTAPPPELTRLMGREVELAHICALLASHRMVTLTGAGGIGKTRLAQRAAADLAAHYPDGVGWIDLGPVGDGPLVGPAIAAALGVRTVGPRSTTETLADWLRDRRLLLALDNCERFAGEVGRLAAAWLQAAPRLRILATSQQPLGVPGELAWRVPPLSAPEGYADAAGSGLHLPPEALAALGQNASIQLFVERAQAALPTFSLTASNAAHVARICRRLGGIPLAIELAATRINTLAVQQIAERLDDALALLGPAEAPRQQALAAAVAWSHDLLTQPERTLFRRLAVFPGSFTLEVAEAVCAGRGLAQEHIVGLLAGLVDKSLVEPEPLVGERRFQMHEALRQFAHARLAEAGEADGIQARHLEVYARLVAEGQAHQTGAQQAIWLERLEAEHDNLAAALACSRDRAGCAQAGLLMVGGLARFWATRGHFKTGRHWARALLAAAEGTPTPGRLVALQAAANLAYYQADYTEAHRFYAQALEVARARGDRPATAAILRGLGTVAHGRGECHEAQRSYAESLALCRQLGDQPGEATALANLGLAAWQHGDAAAGRDHLNACLALRRRLGDEVGIAYVLHLLAEIAWSEGQAFEARSLNDESLAMRRRLGDRWGIAYSLDSLAVIAWQQGEGAHARSLFAESLALFHDLGSQHGLCDVLDHAAGLLADEDQPDPAARLMAAADALRQTIAAALPPNVQPAYDQQLARIRGRLGDERFRAAWTLGSALLTEQAVASALRMLTA